MNEIRFVKILWKYLNWSLNICILLQSCLTFEPEYTFALSVSYNRNVYGLRCLTVEESRSSKEGNNNVNNNNNNIENYEVFERSFSIEPKARTTNNQTKRRKVPDPKNSHAAHTNVSLTLLSLHLHTHAHKHTCTCTHTRTHIYTHARTRACTHIFPRLLKACLRELKSIGVGDEERSVSSWDLKADKDSACRTEKGRLFQVEGPMKEKVRTFYYIAFWIRKKAKQTCVCVRVCV